MNLKLYPDSCKHYLFFSEWIKGKLLSVVDISNHNPIKSIANQYFNPTAGNRYRYALRHGYSVMTGWKGRNCHLDDIYKINTSADIRQGRQMPEDYHVFPTVINPKRECDRHYVEWVGVVNEQCICVAYCEYYIIGEYGHISRILGHKSMLNDGIMPLLIAGIIQGCYENHVKALSYYLHESGGNGLKYFKHSVGFKPEIISET